MGTGRQYDEKFKLEVCVVNRCDPLNGKIIEDKVQCFMKSFEVEHSGTKKDFIKRRSRLQLLF